MGSRILSSFLPLLRQWCQVKTLPAGHGVKLLKYHEIRTWHTLLKPRQNQLTDSWPMSQLIHIWASLLEARDTKYHLVSPEFLGRSLRFGYVCASVCSIRTAIFRFLAQIWVN